MAYVLEIDSIHHAPLDAAWTVWTDMPRFPEWDPREEVTRLDGPFAVGTTGYSKQRGTPGGPFRITAVEPGRTWQVTSALPGGRLVIDHTLQPLPDGRLKLGKRYVVHGPMAPLFRLIWGPGLRRSVPGTLTALAERADAFAGAAAVRRRSFAGAAAVRRRSFARAAAVR